MNFKDLHLSSNSRSFLNLNKKSISISNLDVFILVMSGLENMKEICGGNCKNLLKVMNKPILFYQLEFLERQGIKEVNIVGNKNDLVNIDVALTKYKGDIIRKLINVEGQENSEGGLEIFSVIKKQVTKSNFLVIEGDSILSFNFGDFLDQHTDNLNLVSMILQKRENNFEKLSFCSKKKLDVFGVDRENNLNRVVYFNQKESSDSLEPLFLDKNVLKYAKNFNFLFNYIDVGCYLFNKNIFNLLNQDNNDLGEELKLFKEVKNEISVKVNSIKEDLLHPLIKGSFYNNLNKILQEKIKNLLTDAREVKVCAKFIENPHLAKKDNNYNINEEFCLKIIDYPTYISTIDEMQRQYNKILPIFFMTKNNDKNYLLNFKEKIEDNLLNNKKFNDGITELQSITENSYIAETIDKIEKNVIVNRTVAGSGLTVLEGSKVKSSLIGINVVIGKNCKITNCVIGDGASFGDGCIVSDCVIGNDYVVKEKANLTNQVCGKEVDGEGDMFV